MKEKIPTPDFECWSKMDVWKFKEAAMLLLNIEPLNYSAVKFNVSLQRIPPELHRAYKIHLIFQSTHWEYQFTQGESNSDAHPFDIILQAHKKGIIIPTELKDLMHERMQREISHQDKHHSLLPDFTSSKNETEELTTRERHNLLKTIGILVSLLIEEKNSPLFQRGHKPNAYQIAQMIIEKAQAHGMETEGLKSIDRKISEAFKIMTEEA